MLTAEQQAARENRVTASFLPALMAGVSQRVLNEWMRLTGHPRYAPEDFSDNWAVHLGTLLEEPALDWHETQTGYPISWRQQQFIHPTLPHVMATIDGRRDADDTVIDVKVCGRWQTLEDIEAYYTPQIMCQMACTGAANGALLVVHGGAEPQELPIYADPDYARVMWQRVEQFWRCVETLTPPVPMPPLVPPDRWRTINLDNEADRKAHNWSEEFIANLFLWSTTKKPHGEHEDSKEQIKTLLPADVGLVIFKGLAVKRARNNAVTVKYAKVAA